MSMRKIHCEELLSISVFTLSKRDLLNGSGIIHALQGGKPRQQFYVTGWDTHVTLQFLNNNQSGPQAIELEFTPNNYGGKRPWFLCPNCDRRCAILYYGGSFACRKCYDLRYETQYLCPEEKTRKRITRLRKKLEADDFSTNPITPRKKHRHHAVHERFVAKLEFEENRYLVQASRDSRW